MMERGIRLPHMSVLHLEMTCAIRPILIGTCSVISSEGFSSMSGEVKRDCKNYEVNCLKLEPRIRCGSITNGLVS